MANAGTVTVDFAAEVAKFNAQLKQVNDRVKNVESGFKSLEKVASTALKFFSVGITARFIQSAAEAADALGKTADKLGISTERLTAFQLAAADAGVQTQTLTRLLSDAQRRLGEASFGQGEALKTLRAFDLNIRELQQLAPDELFLRYADAIGTLTNRSDQFAAAQALFGKSAQEAFTLISEGRPAIEAAAATVDRLGLALSRVDIKKIEEANDKLGLLGRVSQAVGQQLAVAFAPFVSNFVDSVTNAGVAADDARSKFASFARTTVIAFEITANAARAFDAAVSGVLFATFRSFEQLNEIVAKSLDLTARLDRAVGLDTLAKFFEEQAAAQRSLAGFAGAAADEAAARVQAALGSIKSFEQIFAQIDQITAAAQAKAEAAAAAQQAINEALRRPTGETEIEAINANFLTQEEAQRLHFERMLEQQRIFQEASATLTQQLDVDTFIRQQKQREQGAIEAERNILTMRQLAANAGIGLLQALASRSKAAAIALIAVQKGQAIAEALMAGNVATIRALEIYGPTPAGYAAAAAARLYTGLTVAAIAATGFIEGGSVLRSAAPGAPIGAPSNPVFTQSSGTDQTFGGDTKSEVNIFLHGGGVITPQTAKEIAEALKDAIDNSNVHIMSKDSSQAQELRD